MDEDVFREVYTYIFIEIRNKFKSGLTLFESPTNYIDILNSILSINDDFKDIFFRLKDNNIPWIPGPGGINLEKGIGSCTGDLLEHQSVLGPFLTVSFLPVTLSLRVDERFLKTSEKMEAELKSAKSQAAFDKIASNLQEVQRKYTNSLCSLFKTLLKGKNSREDLMRWLAASILGNTARAKLGHNLA
jgi:hypothetical protein